MILTTQSDTLAVTGKRTFFAKPTIWSLPDVKGPVGRCPVVDGVSDTFDGQGLLGDVSSPSQSDRAFLPDNKDSKMLLLLLWLLVVELSSSSTVVLLLLQLKSIGSSEFFLLRFIDVCLSLSVCLSHVSSAQQI